VVPAGPFRQPYMIFLSVGSSGLTEASFPRNLAMPQLLLSNVWIILPLIERDLMTVFTHRGLSPHQFTPMSGAHQSIHQNRHPASRIRLSSGIWTLDSLPKFAHGGGR
jgi:hypothetical protein